MPDSGEEYRVPIVGDVSDLVGSFEEAAGAAEDAGERIKGGMEGAAEGMEHAKESSHEVGEAFGELKEHMSEQLEELTHMTEGWKGLLEVLGAGAIAEAMHRIEETIVEASTEMQMFAARTQTSLTEAKDFVAGMETMGMQTSAMSMAMRKLSSDMATGGKHLDALMGSGYAAASAGKSLGEVYDEVATKIATYGNNVKEAGLANTLLGRSGTVLVAVHETQKQVSEELAKAYEAMGGDTKVLAEQGNQLRLTQGMLNETWQAFAQQLSGAVNLGLKTITGTMMEMMGIVLELIDDVKMLIEALGTLASVAGSVLGAVLSDVQAIGSAMGKAMSGDFAGAGAALQTDNLSKALDDSKVKLQELGDKWNAVDQAQQDRQVKITDEVGHLWDGTIEKISKQWADKMGQGPQGTGEGVPDFAKGGKKGGGKGKADPMAGLDEQLDLSQKKMEDLAREFKQLGSEAAMASKDGGRSFAELQQQATLDYQLMQQDYKKFLESVQSGSKQAASDSEKDWKQATAEFQKDWDKAAARAKQDMQEVKSTANQMSSEVSGILNSAISGKLNWQQEFSKILSKMVDDLVKYLFEMVAMWAAGQNMMQAAQQAAHGNMIGELVAWLATMFGAKKASAAAQATTDAGTSAAGTMAALSSIPYVGPALAAATAPVMYSETLAYGMAAGGFDVPPGMSPLVQLHPRELVMPANLSSGFKNMLESGGQGGGGGGQTNHFNISAWDGKSVAEMFASNGGMIAKAVAQYRRDGGQFNTG